MRRRSDYQRARAALALWPQDGYGVCTRIIVDRTDKQEQVCMYV